MPPSPFGAGGTRRRHPGGYSPPFDPFDDEQVIRAMVRARDWAELVIVGAHGRPVATLLPIVRHDHTGSLVGDETHVEKIDAESKLGQNWSMPDRSGIGRGLEASAGSVDAFVGAADEGCAAPRHLTRIHCAATDPSHPSARRRGRGRGKPGDPDQGPRVASTGRAAAPEGDRRMSARRNLGVP